jgi:hypothetical protein
MPTGVNIKAFGLPAVGSEVAHQVSLMLATVRGSNCTCVMCFPQLCSAGLVRVIF